MPVFRYDPKASAKTTRTAAPTQDDLARWGPINPDPFPPVDTTQPAALRASFVADAAVLLSQAVTEVAALARKRDRLRCKLADPALEHDAHRPAAAERLAELDAEIAERVATICWDEAHADRVWQSLTVPERDSTNAPFFWNVAATAERLIGRAWVGFGAGCTWPQGWRVRREWVVHLPFVLQIDLRIFGVFRWEPHPPGPSIFDGRQATETPRDIAALITDEKGTLR